MSEQQYKGVSFAELAAGIESPKRRAAMRNLGETGASFATRLRQRASLLGVSAAALVPAARPRIQAALQVERYYLAADAIGITRQRAATILSDAQNEWAGSTPSERQLDRAHRDLFAEDRTGTMPEDLQTVIRRLAAETQYSLTEITRAMDILQTSSPAYEGDPWPVDQIVRTLPQLVPAATMGGVGLLGVVAGARAACAPRTEK